MCIRDSLYVKQGKVNASLPEGKGAEDISIKEAIELLAAKKSTSKRKTSSKKIAKSTKKVSTSSSKKTSTKKSPSTTKTGRLRASKVRVIKAK